MQGGYPTMAGPEYGRAAPTLAGPSYDQFAGGNAAYRQYATENPQGAKKRRESSMFGMNIGLGQRKPSNNKLRDDSREFGNISSRWFDTD
jgi:RalA-binding protein 1